MAKGRLSKNLGKKLSILIALSIILSCFALLPASAADDSATTGWIISEVGFTEESPYYDGDNIKLYAKVVNNTGEAYTGNIEVKLSFDGRIVDTIEEAVDMAAGETKIVASENEALLWFGTHAVKAFLSDGTSNNMLKQRFVVKDETNPNPTTTEATTTTVATTEAETITQEQTTIPYVELDTDASGNAVITWRVANKTLDTDENVIMGLSGEDFDIDNTGTNDVTSEIQSALNMLGATDENGVITGGTLYLPAGEYKISGNLTIPKGVTLCGDFANPEENGGKAIGTVLKAYNGKGSTDGKAFITVQPNAGIRDLSIWYPEQSLTNITPYPTTISLNDEAVWGEDCTMVKNVYLVNSYNGIYQEGGACMNINNLYGTPLNLGMRMDGIHDIARWQNISFSYEYWANSGLEGTPSQSELRTYLRANAIAMSYGRIDWSYLSFVDIKGYKTGIWYHESESTANSFPNGQSYDIRIDDCVNSIDIEGGANEELAEVYITNCDNGINVSKKDNAGTDQTLQVLSGKIQTSGKAVSFSADGYILLQDMEIDGDVTVGSGNISAVDCSFKKTSEHVVMNGGGGIFAGNSYGGSSFDVVNNGAYKIEIDETEQNIKYQENVPEILMDGSEYKAARPVIYDVADYGAVVNDGNDDTAAIQSALNKAGNEGGGIVFCEPGHYTINGSMTVPSGVELLGAVDVPRVPIQLGTIFDIYTSKGDASGNSAVNLSANSGIRAICFSQPEQDYETPVIYPYVVKGMGENVYAINVAYQNIYYGIDLFSNKCDNHYVEGTGGFALKTAIRVGGGSENGRVYNYQFNYGPINSGYETKWGSWENSLPSDATAKEEARAKLMTFVFTETEPVIFGDCKNELIFNNFSIFAYKGITFKSEGDGTSGWVIGQGVDASRTSMYVEEVNGDLSFVNTQLVSVNNFGFTDSCYLVSDENMKGTVNMFNNICWGSPMHNVRAYGGTINLYNSNFTPMGTEKFLDVGQNGKFNMYSSYIKNMNKPFADENYGNIGLKYNFFKKTPASSSQYNPYEYNIVSITRWNIPSNYTLKDDEKFVYVEGFEDYPVTTQNGIENAMTGTDSFSEVPASSDARSVTITDNMVRLLSVTDQAYIYDHLSYFASGKSDSIYNFEYRFKAASFKQDGQLWALMHGVDESGTENGSVRIVTMNDSDGKLALSVPGANATLDYNTFYRVRYEFNLTDGSNKTVKATVYDDNYNVIAEGTQNLTAFNAAPTDGIGAFIFNANSGYDNEGSNDVYIDYVVMTQQK